jgi:hypothetical protein
MRIPRLLLLSLLAVCVAPVVAQSSPDKISPDKISPDKSVASSQFQLDGLTNGLSAPPEFRTHVPALSQRALEGISGNLSSPRNYLFKELPPVKLGQGGTSCFSMRTYRVTRDNPQSDTTRLSGYSTCLLAGQYQTKDAVILREIAPR